MNNLIYDVGMNNGDDCEYYLVKGYNVIGIDANPSLCRQVLKRFPDAVKSGRLVIVNTAIGNGSTIEARFFIHSQESVWATLIPQDVASGEWATITVPVCPLSSLIKEHGYPHYVKIDIEGYDAVALQDLGDHGIRPTYISAEAHTFDILDCLSAMDYHQFKITACHDIATDYCNHTIFHRDGSVSEYSFKDHSAGPFGVDLPGRWLDFDEVSQLWRARNTSIGAWYDIHARRI